MNERMRDPEQLLGDENGAINVYDRNANIIGYIPLETAKRFVAAGHHTVVTTQDILDQECTLERI